MGSEFIKTCADPCDLGLSIPEAIGDIVVVGNKIFGREWKNAVEDAIIFYGDTVPTITDVRTALQLQGMEGMFRIVEQVQGGKEEGWDITQTGDSTPKKVAGEFIVQALCVGQTTQLDHPIFSIYGETTKNIVLQCDMGLKIMSSSQDSTAKELYKKVGPRLTDYTYHNKRIAPIMAELYDLEKKTGKNLQHSY